jgi:hypothetical protein
MNRSVEVLANIICSLGALIFVLLMTITGMILLSHGLYFQILSRTMIPWQADLASWVLACGIETTVLIVTANVKFLSRRLPAFFAVCSGLIVLFFIQGFDWSQSILDLTMRWFLSTLVAGLNFTYSELFVKKYQEGLNNKELDVQLIGLKSLISQQEGELANTKSELEKSKADFDQLFTYTEELEKFKEQEVKAKTCSCGLVFKTVYHLAMHRGHCPRKPKEEMKLSTNGRS